MPNEDPRILELSKKLDAPQFRKIVLGHSWRDVDGDQMTALCLAKSFGMVVENAPIVCTNLPSPDDARDPSVMVVEGIPKDQRNGLNSLSTGNFDTGPKDQSATAMIRDASQALIRRNKPKQEILDFVRWFDAVERNGTADIPKTLNPDNLKIWSSVLHGIKLTSQTPQEALGRAYDAFQKVIIAGTLPVLRDQYKPELARLAEIQTESATRLQEAIHNEPQRISTAETGTGLRVSTIDIRGLGVEKGAMNYAVEHGNPDVVLLIDDAYNDEGKPEKTQFKIKSTSSRYNLNLQELLAERLSLAESLFGSGYAIVTKTGFDGHPGIIGSPRTGSDLDPTMLRHAVETFFDTPRFPVDDWKGLCQNLCGELSITQFVPTESFSVSNPAKLPDRDLIMVIPDNQQNRLVRISESDLPLYLEELASMKHEGMKPDEMRRWLLTKTEITEPEAIAVRRQKQALAGLEKALEAQNAGRILDMLDQINPNQLENLDSDVHIRILETVSNSETALRHVLDPNDLLYNLDTSGLPDWIKDNTDVQKTARFTMRAVQWKFNSVLLDKIAALSQHEQYASHIAESLQRIITSDAYKNARTSDIPDKILETVKTIKNTELLQLWKNTFPDVHIEENAQRQSIPGIDGGWFSVSPEQMNDAKPVTVLIEIGRPIADKVLKPDEVPALHISTAGKWLSDPKEASSILSELTLTQLTALLENAHADVPIRIIRGGFPNVLVHRMVEKLLTTPGLTDEVKNRIVFVDFDQGKQQFYETPLLDTTKNPAE
jgi:hypothetical protein